MTSRVHTVHPGWALLMASTMLAGTPALAAEPASAVQADTATGATELGEVIVTAEKRSENVQSVPMSIQVLDNRSLAKLNVNGFQDFVKFLPEVTFQSQYPDQATLYIRGVSDGGNANHSGPQPSVGSYLDEQPITTIGGTLDVHVYDIARVEVLEGPQGTLYGASSESGTLRFITNQPSAAGFAAGYDLEGNWVDHGDEGYVAEGFVNIPLASNLAVRLVGFVERDAGYIDNVLGTRLFTTVDNTINNAAFVKNDFNPVQSYGGRAALRWDVNENWTVTPSVVAQHLSAPGIFGFEPSAGDLKVNRFQPDTDDDRWVQAALTVQGKIGKYDLTYSGGYFYRWLDTLADYTDYSVAYDAAFGSGASWVDVNGNPLQSPQQEIVGQDRFYKESNELRIASPSTDRLRFIAGLFQERQGHWIIQDYQIQGFGPQVAVPGWPNTIWLTDQYRTDRDEAAFTEASFDITPKLTITGGVRVYHYDNTLYGFYGFSANYSSNTGVAKCVPGLTFMNAPCVDLSKPASEATGETHKVNLTYKLDPDKLVYFTYSTGYRPGGVNRSGAFGPYQADSLTNYEIGWKTGWMNRSIYWNGAIYDEEFNNFQFSFLGPNSLTIIANAPSARIEGGETSIDWRASEQLTLSGGASYNHAVLTANFCGTDETTGAFIPTCSNAFAIGNEGALKGQQLPYTPKFKGNLTARYTFPLTGGWNAHVQGSVFYQSMAFAGLRVQDIAELGNMPGYATADFSVGAEHDNKTVELFVKNAFDTRGQVNRYTPCTVSVCAVSYTGVPAAVYVVPIQPLTVGIKVGQYSSPLEDLSSPSARTAPRPAASGRFMASRAQVGSLAEALEHASSLLRAQPKLAQRQAEAILAAAPGDPRAVLLIGAARRRLGDLAGARALLEDLVRAQPRSAASHCELGLTFAAMGESAGAIAALRAAVMLKRDLADAWRALGDELTAIGDSAGADDAYAELIRASVSDPALMSAADALCEGRLAVAEALLRGHLKTFPTDVAAMRMLAETGTRLGRYGDVEALLDRCLELAPGFSAARYNLALVLNRQQKAGDARAHIERLLAEQPGEPSYLNLLAACLAMLGDFEGAVAAYRALLAGHPAQPRIWLGLGHALKTAGRREEGVDAYRRALALQPGLGEAYWSLANLKTRPFTPPEEAEMASQLVRADANPDDRFHLQYALGKALEDRGEWAASFEHYAAGARLRRSELPYDPSQFSGLVERSAALLAPAFFAEREGVGAPSQAPIFIVGLPRSGSTLIEQILSSHSAVEGTMELPEIVAMARSLGHGGQRGAPGDYPRGLAEVGGDDLTTLGEMFLARTAVYRRLGRPFFIDKMPNNFQHIGLIRLILPQAKIIDARRHPMATGFSVFKQHFARGQAFSYDLADIGRYYRDYAALMAHYDAALPGAVHRVIYEDLVADLEGETRRLLAWCGLDFEPACLRFWETDRAVRTASSEQVRQPIFREGLDQWRHYEPWLAPLKTALGPTLDDWRG